MTMPYCDDCLETFPFDDSEDCRCPSCRERRGGSEDYHETNEGGSMEDRG